MKAREYKAGELTRLQLRDDYGTAVPYATVEVARAEAVESAKFARGPESSADSVGFDRFGSLERKAAGEGAVVRYTSDAKGNVLIPKAEGEYQVRYGTQESTLKLKSGKPAQVQLKNVVSVSLVVEGASADSRLQATLREGETAV